MLKLLPSFGVTVNVVIRRKADLADAARRLSLVGHKYRSNDIYDDLVKAVFQRILMRENDIRVCFARRGKSARTAALNKALANARVAMNPVQEAGLIVTKSSRSNRGEKQGMVSYQAAAVRSAYPSEAACLQVVDYYLWAIQRLYEKGEDRFFNLLANGYEIVMDLDDRRNSESGEWYDQTNLLSLERLKLAAG